MPVHHEPPFFYPWYSSATTFRHHAFVSFHEQSLLLSSAGRFLSSLNVKKAAGNSAAGAGQDVLRRHRQRHQVPALMSLFLLTMVLDWCCCR